MAAILPRGKGQEQEDMSCRPRPCWKINLIEQHNEHWRDLAEDLNA